MFVLIVGRMEFPSSNATKDEEEKEEEEEKTGKAWGRGLGGGGGGCRTEQAHVAVNFVGFCFLVSTRAPSISRARI